MQAARGASLTSSDAGPSGPEASARRAARTILVVVALTAYVVDVASKAWAVERLPQGDIEVLGDWLVLHLVRNPGAAFSTGTEFTIVFSCLALVAVLVVLWLSRRLGSPLWAVGLGLLLGGVAGNLTDRIVREPAVMHGHVVDFLMLPNWPVFNIADVCINAAAAVIILQSFRGVTLSGGRARKDDA
jgi:signal peptidase II